MKENPLIVKKRNLSCENRYYSIYFDSLKQEGRVAAKDYLVVTPKTLITADDIFGVGILPIRKDKIGLLEIYRHPIGKYGWELPGGFVEPGESLQTTAIRELKEEASLTCREQNLHTLGSIAPAPSIIAGQVHIFAAVDCLTNTDGSTPELGHYTFKWFSWSAIETLISSGEILEACTLIALYRAKDLFETANSLRCFKPPQR